MDGWALVYTDLFKIRRYLTHHWDQKFPFAIPIVPGIVAVVVSFVEFRLGLLGLVNHLGAPLNVIGMAVLPGLGWYLSDRPEVEGRSLQAWLLSQLRYWVLEGGEYTDEVEPVHEPRQTRAALASWSARGE